MEKVVFEDNKVTLTKDELQSLLLKAWVRGSNEGALYSQMKYEGDTSGIKQMNKNPNRLFFNFLDKLFKV